ncbi:hypothetical protein QMG61_05180 [Cryobacterium sp. PH31-AA6]|uniref:hypothetical protein n=1 Tax=Cryobacterium sp. PH31-AA6 TaxID=3046205 RepID=UPI0024B99257|nr:hypothetical protein [Cryobacterium sp. PH31-AA6]MDJ0323155.1 hypothetical protein [Cryobacterium sp. PH31-AA6]
MAYIKKDWQNKPSTGSPITEANLDHLETQYDEALSEVINQAGVPSSLVGVAVATAALATDANSASALRMQQDARQATNFAPVVSLAGSVSASNAAAANTAAIQAAVNKAQLTGATVVFPPTPSGGFIDIAGRITITGGITIRGAGKYRTRIRQTVFPEMVFDVTGPNVTIEGFWLEQAAFVVGGGDSGTYRGASPLYAYNAGVAVFANNVTVRRVHAENLITGVYYGAWNTTTDTLSPSLTGGSVDDLTVNKVVFGLVANGVAGFSHSRLKGHYYSAPGTSAPPHLIYFVESRPNTDVTGTDCLAVGGETSFAYQYKGVSGGTLSGLNARSSQGLLHLMYCDDVTISDCRASGDTSTSQDVAAVDLEATNSRVRMSRLTVVMAGPGKPFRALDDNSDCVLEKSTFIANHTTDGTTAHFDVEVRGTNNIIREVTATNVGTATFEAGIGVWAGTGNTIISPRTAGNRTGVTIRNTVANVNHRVVDYELSDLGSTTARPLAIGQPTLLRPRIAAVGTAGASRIIAFDDGSLPAGSFKTAAMTLTGQTWVHNRGSWVADGTHIYSSAAASLALLYLNAGTANIDIEAGIKVKNREGLAVRATDYNNSLGARINSASQTLEIFKLAAGVMTVLATVPAVYVIGRRYLLRVVAFGDQVEAYVDGQKLLTCTLSAGDLAAYVATNHGLHSAAGDPLGLFDNVTLRSPA